MKTSHFQKYIFWSYKKNADLPDEVVVSNVLKFGEIKDLLTLRELYTKQQLLNIIEKLSLKEDKRLFFFKKVIL
ncbi:MAG TPA: hypothetical protein ENI76_08095 [Ignavibacteria bacterium]|nr:hypothetical protein [Ignavibacteria bacterium]